MAGKKGSGKNTSTNWLMGLVLQRIGAVDHSFVDEKGRLVVPIVKNNKVEDMIIDLSRETTWVRDNVWPHVKPYSFADKLKQFLIDVFGLSYEQCYGTDDEKNSLTEVKWADWPLEVIKKYKPKSQFMSGRELMQVFGTDLIRRLVPNAWVDACVRQIQKDAPEIALISDCRFPNEVEALQKVDGKVIYLTRNPFNDKHDSEVALDPDKFDHSKFDAVLDNKDMSIGEQNKAVFSQLKIWGYVDFDVTEEK